MAEDPKKLRRQAQKHVRDGKYQQAIELYEDLVDLDPKTARHRLKLADLYARQGRTEEAIEAYRAVGKIHADDDIYQKAVAVYKQALRLAGEAPDLQVRLAEAYEGLGRLKDAAKTYRKAGEMFEERGERERQIDMLERLCDLDHDDVGIRVQLAETYAKVDRKQEAVDLFNETADVLEEEGRFDEFIQVAERTLYFDPDDRRIRKRLIRRYLGRGDNKRALKHLQICYNADRSDVETLEMLCEAFDRLGRKNKTKLVLKQLAKRLAELDRPEESAEAWRRILEVDPDNEVARDALEQLGAELEFEQTEQPSSVPSRDGEPGGPDDEKVPDDRGDALDDIEFLDDSGDSADESIDERERVAREQGDGPAGYRQAPTDQESSGSEPPAPPPEHRPSKSHGSSEASDVEQLDPSELEPVQPTSEAPSENGDSAKPPPPTPPDESGEERLGSDTDVDEESVADLTDQVDPVDAPEPTDDSNDRSPMPDERKLTSVEEQDLTETLSEVDVFLKYGLYDKVRELLTGIGPENARALPVLERRRQMYEFTEEPEAEAGVLLEMARQTESDKDATRYLSAARERTERTERVDDVARELGLATEEVIDNDRSLPRFESGDMPDGDEPTFEQPPSDLQPAEPDEPAQRETVSSGDSESSTAQSETDGDMAFDAEALEQFEGIEQVDEVQSEAFDEELDTEPDHEVVEGERPDVEPVNSEVESTEQTGELEEDADALFGAIDDQFADELFDSLVMGDDESEEQVNIGGDDETGDLAEIDFYIQQGLYDQAEEALEEFEAEHPGHEGIDKRRYQIKTARQGAFVKDNPTGAASLSGKFQPEVDAEEDQENDRAHSAGTNEADRPDAMNTNIEVGEAYRDMGMYKEAIEEFREATDDPEVAPHAQFRIALCEADRGNADEAADTLESLLSESDLPEEVRTAAKSKLDDLEGPRLG